MHEKALLDDLVHELERIALVERSRVVGVHVRLGALSHFTPSHFEEHFVDATRGTAAEGAAVVAEASADVTDPRAQGVVLESVDLAPL